jgi:hypothetical protein
MLTSRTVLAVVAFLVIAPGHAQTDMEQRTAMPSTSLLWGSKMTIENQACCTAPQTVKPADRAEAAVLAAVRDRAVRDGPVLKLKLQENRTLKITDCNDQDACEADRFRVHRLAAWWPSLRYYVVNVGLYEDSMAYQISERDGRTTRVSAPPVLSPSGRQAVALLSNLMSGVELDVIDMTTDPPTVLEVSTMPDCAGAGPDSFLRPTPVWIDDSHIGFEGKSPQPADNPDTKQLLRIVDGKPQWQC